MSIERRKISSTECQSKWPSENKYSISILIPNTENFLKECSELNP